MYITILMSASSKILKKKFNRLQFMVSYIIEPLQILETVELKKKMPRIVTVPI